MDSFDADFDSSSGRIKYMDIIYQISEKRLFAIARTFRHITTSFNIASPTPLCHVKSAQHLCDATTQRISRTVSFIRHLHLANPRQRLPSISTCHCESCSVSSALGSKLVKYAGIELTRDVIHCCLRFRQR